MICWFDRVWLDEQHPPLQAVELDPAKVDANVVAGAGFTNVLTENLRKRRSLNDSMQQSEVLELLHSYKITCYVKAHTKNYSPWKDTFSSWMYRVAQKECSKFSIEKSLVFFSVNVFENLHASTYDILVYIYKVKKIAAASPRLPAAAACGRPDRH